MTMMMKKLAVLALATFAPLAALHAVPINLSVDSAPNVYGSADYAPWWSAAQADVAGGAFTNMRNSVDPANAGTTNFDLRDAVVYSFGDLGRRLHFIYWIPGETIASLTAKNFQIALDYVWDGVTYDFYNDYYGSTWLTPSSWTEYNGGVIGTAGFAWWGAYGVNTQEALDADLAAWAPSQGDITFYARVDGEAAVSLTAHHAVPDAASTVLLLGLTLIGLAGWRRRIG